MKATTKVIALACLAVLALAVSAYAADPVYIYGFHDNGGEYLMANKGAKGWLVFTEAIGSNPNDYGGRDYSSWYNAGYGVIVRLNNGYGSSGTLPYQSQYDNFAQRCKNYVNASSGVNYWIIGNECNLPREWPGNVNGDPTTGEPITSARYISCYTKCWNKIKELGSSKLVCPAPSGTWAPPYSGQGIEGFLDYWVNCLNGIGASKIDGLIIHTYTHGCDPGLITSTQTMGAPYTGIYYHFRVYKNYMWNVPSTMTTKPVMITESDQNVECASNGYTWYNSNNGWVRAAYAEINSWNQNNSQKIRCLALFRWPDVWEGSWNFSISTRQGVIDDFNQALDYGYTWGTSSGGGMSDSVPSGTNLALKATQISVDSSYSSSYDGNKARDGSTSTKWCSTGSSSTHWLVYDLGANYSVNGFIVKHASAGGEASYYNTQQFKIQSGTSMSGPWTDETVVSNTAQASVTNRSYSTAKTMRYVRLYITDPGVDNYARIPEFEVRGTDPGMNTNTPSGTNVALSASSWQADTYYSSSYDGSKAKDGTVSTKWCSTGSSSTHWLSFDLGSMRTVKGFIVRHASTNGEPTITNTQQFSIQSSTSMSGPWVDEVAVSNSAQASVSARSYNTAKAMRYVRLYITDPGADNYARIPEFEVIQ